MLTYKQFILENEENSEEDDTIHYPGGVYISVKMREESIIALKAYADKYLKGHEFNEDQHCTLIYSKKEQKELIEPNDYEATATVLHFSKFGKEGETLVAELKCDFLIERNKELVKEYDFISDFEDYKPHFTLVYDAKDIDVNSLPEIDFAIHFFDEEVEPLNEDWNNTKDDKDGKDSDNEKLDTENGTITGNALNKMKNDEEKADKLDKEKE